MTQTLNPPPPSSFETYKTIGKWVICDVARTESYGPDDTGIACGSGAGACDAHADAELASQNHPCLYGAHIPPRRHRSSA